MLTFKEWVLKFVEVDLPIGDIARDLAQDPKFPRTMIYLEMLNYLEEEANASDLVIDNIEKAYYYYMDCHGLLPRRR